MFWNDIISPTEQRNYVQNGIISDDDLSNMLQIYPVFILFVRTSSKIQLVASGQMIIDITLNRSSIAEKFNQLKKGSLWNAK